MHIYLVRHGETKWNIEEIFRGTKDIPLNENGKRQAEKAGLFFADKGIGRIISSPLIRARQTAAGISKATGVPVEVIAELADMDFGCWEGLTLDEVRRRYPEDFDRWIRYPQRFSPVAGESLAKVRRRVAKALNSITSEEGKVVLVTHRVLCKLIVLHFLGMPSSRFWNIQCDPGSITFFEKEGKRVVLGFLNYSHQSAPVSGRG